MSSEIRALIGTAIVDRQFCQELLDGKRPVILADFDLTNEERESMLAVEAHSIRGFAARLYERLIVQEGCISH
jgi:hypothetical protein